MMQESIFKQNFRMKKIYVQQETKKRKIRMKLMLIADPVK